MNLRRRAHGAMLAHNMACWAGLHRGPCPWQGGSLGWIRSPRSWTRHCSWPSLAHAGRSTCARRRVRMRRRRIQTFACSRIHTTPPQALQRVARAALEGHRHQDCHICGVLRRQVCCFLPSPQFVCTRRTKQLLVHSKCWVSLCTRNAKQFSAHINCRQNLRQQFM